MSATKIPWTDASWNPVTGCTAGCSYCYARKMSRRLKAMGQARYANGFAPTFHPDALSEPLRWRKPRRVFVGSMGDLFDPAITDEKIAAVFGVMAACPQHTFQVLTKQARRMRSWFERVTISESDAPPIAVCCGISAVNNWADVDYLGIPDDWPLRNVALMVTAENQAAADERIPDLLATPAAVRGVSIEPILGPVDLRRWIPHLSPGYEVAPASPSGREQRRCQACGRITAGFEKRCNTVAMRAAPLSWVIVGADSTRGAPEMPEQWARDVRDQCVEAGVQFFYKQRVVGGKRIELPTLDGQQWAQFPEVRT